MKTKSLFIAALVTVGAAMSAFGKEEPTNKGLAVVAVKGSEVFKVIYKGDGASRVKLNVYNASSEVVFSESFAAVEGFIRPLNFKGLQSGEYTIELVDATGKKIEKLTYQPAKSGKNIHISKLGNDDGKYMIAMASTGSEDITVKIFDAQNNLIHTEVKTVDGGFAQLYTVKNITGAVTFEVSDASGNRKVATF